MDDELEIVSEEDPAPEPTNVPVAVRKVFEVENYRKGTLSAIIYYDNGEWSSNSELGKGLIETARRVYSTDEERFDYLSNFTNQVIASRLVEED